MQSDTATVSSGAPLSPFSSATSVSGISGDATSDEGADLGNFGSVWRALQQFRITTANTNAQPVPVYVTSASESEEAPRRLSSLSWNHHYYHHPNNPSPSFITSDDDMMTHNHLRNRSRFRPESEPEPDSVFYDLRPGFGLEEGTRGATGTASTGAIEEGDVESGIPSLGDLDIALGFIAAEKARLAAQLDARSPAFGTHGTSPEAAWKHVVEPKRKRRRRRKNGKGDSLLVDDDDDDDPEEELEETYSSSPRNTTPIPIPIPISRRRRPPRPAADSSSSPSTSAPARMTLLQRPLPTPPDPRLQRLRTLARKLRSVCPKESDLLRRILLEDTSPDAPYVDPRGPEPMSDERTHQPLVHVFVDHSNILVGFLSWIKRQSNSSRLLQSPTSKTDKPRLSHPALVLILERGRAVSKRVLVASSPLHQDLDPLAELEYEVSVLQRIAVVDDNDSPSSKWKNNRGRRTAPPTSVFNSDGTSTESDPVVVGNTAFVYHGSASSSAVKLNRTPPARLQHHRAQSSSSAIPPHLQHSSSGTIPSTSSSPSSITSSSSTTRPIRYKYREQAVDELLQLKLLQALLDTPSPPPPGSTIVLATGDGASSQFNSDGFKGCVRKAVERGWMVELVAWEGGLSRSWVMEFRDFREWFSILELDQFAEDLVDL